MGTSVVSNDDVISEMLPNRQISFCLPTPKRLELRYAKYFNLVPIRNRGILRLMTLLLA
jgi:hypothetical protein